MMLEIGYNHPYEIRRYLYPFERASGTTILYLSDLHYTRFSKRQAENIAADINNINPAIILLGGDYADSGKGLQYFKQMITSIEPRKHIFAIAGNHDRMRIQQVRKIIEDTHVTWLHDRSAIVKAGALTIRIDGNSPARKPADADLSILCLHKPIDISKIAHHYNLIFAGHLHGSQVVLWETPNGLYPGRLLYKWNRLSADLGHCRYLISKGLGDTLPVRYNCPKDAILVKLTHPSIQPKTNPQQ